MTQKRGRGRPKKDSMATTVSTTPQTEISSPEPPQREIEALCWGSAVSKAFVKRVREIADELECDASHLMAVMALETKGRFLPDIRNMKNGDAGLLQFPVHAAIDMNINPLDLMRMTAVQQLDYVEKWLLRFKGQLTTLADVYMASMWPKAVGETMDFVLYREGDGTRIYFEERGVPVVDGVITKQQCAERAEEWLARGMEEGNAHVA